MTDVSADPTALRRELEAARQQQRSLARILEAIAGAEGLQPVLDEIVEQVTILCGGDNVRMWLLEDGLLHAVANGGWEAGWEYDQAHPHVLDSSSASGRAALTHQAVHIQDVLEDPEYAYEGPVAFRTNLSVPILLGDELIGVFGIVRKEPQPFSDHQVELVKTFADQAAIAIANARLIEAVERQRAELSRFISPQVAELIASEDGERMLAGHRAYITVMFCDLRGFTGVTEVAEPEELFEILRAYHRTLGELIPRYEGTLEHFAGDGVMVFFNDPAPVDDHELKAIRLAVDAHESVADLVASWRKRGHRLGLGIGISAGYATLGRIGFEGRYDYGALGPVSNLASRLSSHAKAGQTLIGQRVLAAVEDHVNVTPVGELELKGFREPVPTYAVSGLRGSLSAS